MTECGSDAIRISELKSPYGDLPAEASVDRPAPPIRRKTLTIHYRNRGQR